MSMVLSCPLKSIKRWLKAHNWLLVTYFSIFVFFFSTFIVSHAEPELLGGNSPRRLLITFEWCLKETLVGDDTMHMCAFERHLQFYTLKKFRSTCIDLHLYMAQFVCCKWAAKFALSYKTPLLVWKFAPSGNFNSRFFMGSSKILRVLFGAWRCWMKVTRCRAKENKKIKFSDHNAHVYMQRVESNGLLLIGLWLELVRKLGVRLSSLSKWTYSEWKTSNRFM